MLEQATIDDLWVFDEPALSERRFRVELEEGGPWDAVERAELVTQLARSLGLQGRFDEAAAMLIDLDAESSPVVAIRVLLESGRLMNSSGHPDAAVGLFRQAEEIAARVDAVFLRLDTLHMLAIVDADRAADWTTQAVELAEAAGEDRTKRWLVPLHSNYGWRLLEADDLDAALAEFVEAERWADLVGTDEQRRWTPEAVDECRAAIAARHR
jgi:tetratricopeptide (TPR) repeat protein